MGINPKKWPERSSEGFYNKKKVEKLPLLDFILISYLDKGKASEIWSVAEEILLERKDLEKV